MDKLLNLLYVGVTRARQTLSIPPDLLEVLADYVLIRDEYMSLTGG
jgi:ATP-dependent exoDNAse (exonuclease V) alpha subunit